MTECIIVAGHKYAPGCWIICRKREDGSFDYQDEANTVLCQTDWDWPALASNTGFVPCECGATDGTVDCPHHKASDMIAAAYDWLEEHEGQLFDDPGYFQ